MIIYEMTIIDVNDNTKNIVVSSESYNDAVKAMKSRYGSSWCVLKSKIVAAS